VFAQRDMRREACRESVWQDSIRRQPGELNSLGSTLWGMFEALQCEMSFRGENVSTGARKMLRQGCEALCLRETSVSQENFAMGRCLTESETLS